MKDTSPDEKEHGNPKEVDENVPDVKWQRKRKNWMKNKPCVCVTQVKSLNCVAGVNIQTVCYQIVNKLKGGDAMKSYKLITSDYHTGE